MIISTLKRLQRGLVASIIILGFAVSSIHAQGLDDAMNYSASGIIAQKLKLHLITMNLANLTTLEDESTGLPWQKRFAIVEPTKDGVKVTSVERSDAPFGRYYDPAVPQSDDEGFFAYPNVNEPDEMVNLAFTEIVFDANLTTFRSTKSIYQNMIDMMK